MISACSACYEPVIIVYDGAIFLNMLLDRISPSNLPPQLVYSKWSHEIGLKTDHSAVPQVLVL